MIINIFLSSIVDYYLKRAALLKDDEEEDLKKRHRSNSRAVALLFIARISVAISNSSIC